MRLSPIDIKVYKRNTLPPKYWRKASFPTEAFYEFETINEIVKIEPIDAVLPQQAVRVINQLKNKGEIEMNGCYLNSLRVALALKKIGISVKCVDGFYMVDRHSCMHRFCEYNGRYFDATYECLLGTSLLTDGEYTAIRAFEPYELLAAGFAFAKLEIGNHSFLGCSTLSGSDIRAQGRDDYSRNYYINDNGVFTRN